MATDAKKHTTLAAAETPSRQGLAASLLSVNDVVPVASATEQAQVATALVALGFDLASTPLSTLRANAPALHRLEYSYDGSVFLPASGVLHFPTETAANDWASAHSTLLALGDRCYVGGTQYVWQANGRWRLAALSGTHRATPGGFPASTMQTVCAIDLPDASPAGPYTVAVSSITGSSATGAHYQRVLFDGVEVSQTGTDYVNSQPANVDLARADTLLVTHDGGAAEVRLAVQVNAASPYLRGARMTVAYVGN